MRMLGIVGLNVFTALIILVSSELLLRVIFPEKVEHTSDSAWIEQSFSFNPIYLVSVKPNLQRQFTRNTGSGKVSTYWRTNRDSFRGNELREKRDLRVIVYGDS